MSPRKPPLRLGSPLPVAILVALYVLQGLTGPGLGQAWAAAAPSVDLRTAQATSLSGAALLNAALSVQPARLSLQSMTDAVQSGILYIAAPSAASDDDATPASADYVLATRYGMAFTFGSPHDAATIDVYSVLCRTSPAANITGGGVGAMGLEDYRLMADGSSCALPASPTDVTGFAASLFPNSPMRVAASVAVANAVWERSRTATTAWPVPSPSALLYVSSAGGDGVGGLYVAADRGVYRLLRDGTVERIAGNAQRTEESESDTSPALEATVGPLVSAMALWDGGADGGPELYIADTTMHVVRSLHLTQRTVTARRAGVSAARTTILPSSAWRCMLQCPVADTPLVTPTGLAAAPSRGTVYISLPTLFVVRALRVALRTVPVVWGITGVQRQADEAFTLLRSPGPMAITASGLLLVSDGGIEMLGDYSYIGRPNEGIMVGAFTTTNAPYPSSALLTTLPQFSTTAGCTQCDIANDFAIAYALPTRNSNPPDFRSRVTTIPTGAKFLLVALFDDAYGDNTATDNDLGVKITRSGVPPSPPAPAEVCYHWFCAMSKCFAKGQQFDLVVTGIATSTQAIYGSSVYTDDSDIRLAAVHSSVLEVGETATITVMCYGAHEAYASETRHGISSVSWGYWQHSWALAKKE